MPVPLLIWGAIVVVSAVGGVAATVNANDRINSARQNTQTDVSDTSGRYRSIKTRTNGQLPGLKTLVRHALKQWSRSARPSRFSKKRN